MGFRKVHAIVSGRVQGVGFRFFVQRMAELIGVSGYVRNLPAGKVEIMAVGDDERVADFFLSVENGSSMAEVTDVDKSEESCDYNEYKRFEIKF